MERPAAIQQIRDAARTIVQSLMKIHPAIPLLDDAETQDACFKHLHQLTTELEAIKKKLAILERKDASAEL
jgi:thymidylate synthase ThyX